MPALEIGPLLRHVGPTTATVWVETDGPCEVAALGATTRTFQVAGHHYALVEAEDLRPGTEHEYDLRLDGEVAWPRADERLGHVRTPRAETELRLAFASCRVADPHKPPYTLSKSDDPRGRGVDALAALARQMRGTDPRSWPDALLLVGDQVYADEVTPTIRERMRLRHERTGRGEMPMEVADFEEYTWLYHEAWGDEEIRWLLASIPSAMIFDDHDVRDDWNTSRAWLEEVRELPWWRERLIGAYMSYWLYQHLGNLSPDELGENELLAALRALPPGEDGAPLLRAFAERAADEIAGTRWSFRRDFGRTRLIVLDSRAGRIVADDGNRRMLSDEQWAWMREHLTGDVDHLLIATSLPYLMAPALHDLEAWNEAVCAGAWGERAGRVGERLRRALDLEHWPAFQHSFHRLADDLRAVGAGERGRPPGSIVLLSGDVHHAYVAEAAFPRAAGVESTVVQAVCSPMRNPLDARERRVLRALHRGPAAKVARLLARAAGVRAPRMRWRLMAPATFDNHVGILELDGREALLRIECTRPQEWREPQLHPTFERPIAEI